MAKSKKTRKTVSESSAPVVESTPKPVFSKPKEPVEKKPSTFTAILKGAATYNLAGRTFIKGVPVDDVPMKHFRLFKENGWFITRPNP